MVYNLTASLPSVISIYYHFRCAHYHCSIVVFHFTPDHLASFFWYKARHKSKEITSWISPVDFFSPLTLLDLICPSRNISSHGWWTYRAGHDRRIRHCVLVPRSNEADWRRYVQLEKTSIHLADGSWQHVIEPQIISPI